MADFILVSAGWLTEASDAFGSDDIRLAYGLVEPAVIYVIAAGLSE